MEPDPQVHPQTERLLMRKPRMKRKQPDLVIAVGENPEGEDMSSHHEEESYEEGPSLESLQARVEALEARLNQLEDGEDMADEYEEDEGSSEYLP